jgi:hypothetical protein
MKNKIKKSFIFVLCVVSLLFGLMINAGAHTFYGGPIAGALYLLYPANGGSPSVVQATYPAAITIYGGVQGGYSHGNTISTTVSFYSNSETTINNADGSTLVVQQGYASYSAYITCGT